MHEEYGAADCPYVTMDPIDSTIMNGINKKNRFIWNIGDGLTDN